MLIDQIYLLEVILSISVQDLSFKKKDTTFEGTKMFGDLLDIIQHGFIFLLKVTASWRW